MSTLSGFKFLFLLIGTLNIAATRVEGQLTQWYFANFSAILPGVANLQFIGDSVIVNATGTPRIVLNSDGALTGVPTAGRATYPSKVEFKEDATLSFASFQTNFTFAISNLGAGPGCYGFTFFIRADNSSLGDSGKYLGLTTSKNDGSQNNSLFAVEFDTSQDLNVSGPSASHIGVDVNGVNSVATYDLCASAANCTNLTNNGVFYTKIGYYGEKKSLQVALYLNTTILVANWTVPNLSLNPVFQKYMYVGFSGSNGVGCNQTHEIYSWGFSTSRSTSSPPTAGGTQGPLPHISYSCYQSGGCRSHRVLVIGLTLGIGGSASVLLLFFVFFYCYRRKQGTQQYSAVEDDLKSAPALAKGGALLMNAAAKINVEAPTNEVSPPMVEGDLSSNKLTSKDIADPNEDFAPVSGQTLASKTAVQEVTASSSVPIASTVAEPAPVAPVAEPVNRNADGKITLCCVQTKPKRDYREPVVFSYKELAQATKNFSDKELIGGTPEQKPVYRGVLRDNGAAVAIKETTLDNISNEFVSKAMLLGRIRHPNLVHLLGWCRSQDKGKLYLVYDYMPKGSLDKLLLLSKDADGFLGFDTRLDALVGVGAGLTYLHEGWEQCVLHGDVKPSNVLLDATSNVHLGNFSRASLVDHDKVAESTVLDGTVGYLAPELPFTGKLTVKSDVFSFGILALEVACGRLPVDWHVRQEDRSLLDCVWQAHEEDELLRVVDKRLENAYNKKQMTTVLQVGLYCSHPDPSLRPNMAFVWQILLGRAKVPELPPKKPVVGNYAALNLGIRNTGPRPIGTSSDTQRRFSGMEIS